jgi:glutamine amidotransferase
VQGIPDDTRFYFVHSYAPDTTGETVGVTVHGRSFAAVTSRENVFATQFHPEKSGEAGLAIYANFVKAIPRT